MFGHQNVVSLIYIRNVLYVNSWHCWPVKATETCSYHYFVDDLESWNGKL